MRESNSGGVFSEIGTPSALEVRRDERESVVEQLYKHPILGWLECGCDRGSNDDNLLQISLLKFIFQSQCFTAFLRRQV